MENKKQLPARPSKTVADRPDTSDDAPRAPTTRRRIQDMTAEEQNKLLRERREFMNMGDDLLTPPPMEGQPIPPMPKWIDQSMCPFCNRKGLVLRAIGAGFGVVKACADCLKALQDIPPVIATQAVAFAIWSALARHACGIAWATPEARAMLDQLDAGIETLLQNNTRSDAVRAFMLATRAMPPHGVALACEEFRAFGMGDIYPHVKPIARRF
ncbi:MAG: hypothetical protein GYA24_16295 [Candidatus Lokiarchaeota archaeon]|nr:hypothetical protein [Candidatus Lokiarchaeota archaeon]